MLDEVRAQKCRADLITLLTSRVGAHQTGCALAHLLRKCEARAPPLSFEVSKLWQKEKKERKSLPRLELIREDWNLIDLQLFEGGYRISWAQKTLGMLSTVAETLDSFLHLSQPPSVPRASCRHALWCQQLVRQLVSVLSSTLRPRTPSYHGLSSSPVSQSMLSSPDSWQPMRIYRC